MGQSRAARWGVMFAAIAIVAATILAPAVSSPGRDARAGSAPGDGRAQDGATVLREGSITAPTSQADRAWGPTAAEWSAAVADARALTLEQAAGLVIVPAWSSTDTDAAARFVEHGAFGGLILMGGAIESAAQVRDMTSALQAASPYPWGAIVSTDQEGGTVARLEGAVPDLPGFMAAGATHDPELVRRVYAQAGVDLKSLGITVDYAPVADMTIGAADPTMGTRSPGDDADDVAATVNAAVTGYLEGGVIAVVKHFPGHGSVTVDSHVGLPVHKATVAQLEKRDLKPFAQAVDAGAPAIMMAHIVVGEWGAGPATLEPEAYAYLRERLGFDGVIVTDALNMTAITAAHAPGEAAVEALAAGADVLLMPADPWAARDAVVAAVKAGEVSRERLDEAAARVIALQRWRRELGPQVDTGDTYARALAIAGATVAARDCAAPLVTGPVLVTGGYRDERDGVAQGLKSLGIEATATAGSAPPSASASPSASPDDGHEEEPATVVALVSPGADVLEADVQVALGGPWTLEGRDADAYVGLYGRSDDALHGLVEVLAGTADAGGAWPVDVDLPYAVCE